MSKIAMLHFSDMLIYISCRRKYVISASYILQNPWYHRPYSFREWQRKLYLEAITANFVPPMIDEMVLKDFLKRHVATYITAEIGTALFKMVFVAI